MKKKQVKKKQRSLAADIQTVLLWVLRGISFFYLIMMGVVLPFYYHPETSYMTIGSGKAEFYNKWAFGTAKAAKKISFSGLFPLEQKPGFSAASDRPNRQPPISVLFHRRATPPAIKAK